MIRRFVRGTGKTLISVGVLLLLFVGYQLWGTGLRQDREQRSLRSQFARELAAPAAAEPAPAATPTSAPASGRDVCTECAGIINIPKIGLDQVFVEGVEVEDLKKGVGHYTDTKRPGESGNAALAGHRTTYGAPFNRLDELAAGDPIDITTRDGTFRYEVIEWQIVTPDDVWVLDDTPDNRLTLTTCHPKYSAAERLIVTASLVGPAVDAPDAAVEAPPTTSPPRSSELAAGQERPGLSGGSAASRPAIAWAILAASIWLAAWAVGRWTGRRWTAYVVGAPIFLVALFVFFENVARLLPANV